jgi:hypothetical protein
MSTPTETELKDLILEKYNDGEGNFSGLDLKEVLDKFAETVNAKKQGYRYLKAVVFAEQFGSTEIVNIQDSQTKLLSQDNIDFSVLTVERVSLGKYKVTTGHNDANTSNLRDNGRVIAQPFKDLASNNNLRNASLTFSGDTDGISHIITYDSVGVFHILFIAAKGTENENLVDCNFYLNIELFNMPNL